jgi:hypothetical protein
VTGFVEELARHQEFRLDFRSAVGDMYRCSCGNRVLVGVGRTLGRAAAEHQSEALAGAGLV